MPEAERGFITRIPRCGYQQPIGTLPATTMKLGAMYESDRCAGDVRMTCLIGDCTSQHLCQVHGWHSNKAAGARVAEYADRIPSLAVHIAQHQGVALFFGCNNGTGT